MDEKPPRKPDDHQRVEPALNLQGEPARFRETNPDPDAIALGPEMAVAEADVRSAEQGEYVRGSSLWRDAWRRLLKNKLAVFGLVVVIVITLASIFGPLIIKATTGITPDYIPSNDVKRIKSFPPFTGVNGEFSWAHPMGTDNAGRDLLARVLQGGQISLFVGIISTLVSLIIGVSYGAIAGYLGGRVDNLLMRLVDVLYSLPYVILVIVLLSMFRSQTPRGQLVLLFVALGSVSWLTMARIVRGQVLSLKNQEFVLAARATGVSTATHHFSPPGSQHAWAGYRLCNTDNSAGDVDGGIPFLSWLRSSGTTRFLGQSGIGRRTKHCDLSLAVDLSGSHDGIDSVFTKLSWRRIERCTRSADEN